MPGAFLRDQKAIPVYNVDDDGNPTSSGGGGSSGATQTYTLANNVPLAATTGTSPTTVTRGGAFVWDAQFTGTSLQLQSLGSDNSTWRTTATLTSSGTFSSLVAIGVGTQVRLYNPNGTGLTGVYSNLLQEG